MFSPDLAPYFQIYLKEVKAGPTRLPIDVNVALVRDATEIEAAIADPTPGGGLIVARIPSPSSIAA